MSYGSWNPELLKEHESVWSRAPIMVNMGGDVWVLCCSYQDLVDFLKCVSIHCMPWQFWDFKWLGIFIIFTKYSCFTGERVHENPYIVFQRQDPWCGVSWTDSECCLLHVVSYKVKFWKQNISYSVGNLERGPSWWSREISQFLGESSGIESQSWVIL